MKAEWLGFSAVTSQWKYNGAGSTSSTEEEEMFEDLPEDAPETWLEEFPSLLLAGAGLVL